MRAPWDEERWRNVSLARYLVLFFKKLKVQWRVFSVCQRPHMRAVMSQRLHHCGPNQRTRTNPPARKPRA